VPSPAAVSPRLRKADLYFIYSPATMLVKIGIARDVTQRLAGLEYTCGARLKLLGAWKGLACHEKRLHILFGDVRQLGEWFLPVPDLLDLALGEKTLADIEALRAHVVRAWEDRAARTADNRQIREAVARQRRAEAKRVAEEQQAKREARRQATRERRAAEEDRAMAAARETWEQQAADALIARGLLDARWGEGDVRRAELTTYLSAKEAAIGASTAKRARRP